MRKEESWGGGVVGGFSGFTHVEGGYISIYWGWGGGGKNGSIHRPKEGGVGWHQYMD